jgi:hypothetical protein
MFPPRTQFCIQASAKALSQLLAPSPFTYSWQTPTLGVICLGHGMGVQIGVHNIAFLQNLQQGQFPAFKNKG